MAGQLLCLFIYMINKEKIGIFLADVRTGGETGKKLLGRYGNFCPANKHQ